MQLPLALQVSAIGPPIKPANINSANAASVLIAVCDDGLQRFCKGNSSNPYAPANEWISAMVAKLAGFSVIDPAIVNIAGKLYFGTPYLDSAHASFALGGPQDPVFLRSVNKDSVLYQAMALDAFTANPDRHTGNVVACTEKASPVSEWRLYLHDHDRALFGAPMLRYSGDRRLSHFNRDPDDGWDIHHTAWVRTDSPWYSEITDWNKMMLCARDIRSIPKNAIRAVVEQVPGQWMNGASKILLFRFLLKRQRFLESIINNRKNVFPSK